MISTRIVIFLSAALVTVSGASLRLRRGAGYGGTSGGSAGATSGAYASSSASSGGFGGATGTACSFIGNSFGGGGGGNGGGGADYTGTGGYGGATGGGAGGLYRTGGASGGFGYPFAVPPGCPTGFGPDFLSIQQNIQDQIRKIQDFHQQLAAKASAGASSNGNGFYFSGPNYEVWGYPFNSIDYIFGLPEGKGQSGIYGGGAGGYGAGGNSGIYGSSGGGGAYASGAIGPKGGYGNAGIVPPAPGGLDLRFGADGAVGGGGGSGPVNSASGSFGAPSGGHVGIMTSSSSGSSTVNGQTKSFKKSSVTLNDNGKVTTYEAHDP